MKTPTWEPSAGNLLSFLNSNTALGVVDLYTFTTANGAAYLFTSGNAAVTIGGRTFIASPQIERSTFRQVVGIEVDSLTVTMHADQTVMLGSLPMIQALAQGAMDNGTVRVERLFYNASFVPQGAVLVFTGIVGQISPSRGHVEIEVLSQTQLLNIMIPTSVYQPSCRNNVYDLGCGLSRSAYQQSFTVSSGLDATKTIFGVTLSGAAAADGYLNLGSVKFTSGANAGVARTIKWQSATGYIATIAPWPYAVNVGDAFVVVPGCDRTMTTCKNKFNNLIHFSGEPFIPLPETVL